MLLGTALLFLASTAGYGALRLLGLSRNPLAVGLSPAAGLALFPVLATWSVLLNAPRLTGTLLIAGASLAGLAVLICDRHWLLAVLSRANAPALTLLAAGLGVPMLVLGSAAYVQLGVPNYANDAAFHVETLDALRHGAGWAGWYPPGSHATFASYLQLVPWIDSAAGAAGASLALALAAP